MSYQLLVKASETLRLQYQDNAVWDESPFAWIKTRSAPTKGKLGRDFATALIQSANLRVVRRGTTLVTNGMKIRVKMSMMGEDGSLLFEQIKEEDYKFLICIGLHPKNAYGWIIPKTEMLVDGTLQEREGLSEQHVGNIEPSDYWIRGLYAGSPFQWLQQYGGTATSLVNAIQRMLT